MSEISDRVKLQIKQFTLEFSPKNSWEKSVTALSNITIDVLDRQILSIIGPARSGKTTLLRSINRLIELSGNVSIKGDMLLEGESIYSEKLDVSELRRRAGMVFARPVVLPMSIADNIRYGPRLKGVNGRDELMGLVESSLRSAFLWEEVKNRLDSSALALSGGQQQRLCIARIIALKPEIIMLDEPTSALDPVSTARIEDTLMELKSDYTIILVTNNTKQAARVGTRTAFFLMSELVEYGHTNQIFTNPRSKKTEDYITGRFG
ncbi:MAG TPA: phosphate ABC transporter ATP-binding protein [Candidatus Wallbacteria bacterium]|nr:phosphate ABC transporter ATP-binding protein [Candidatus Wallbacteria bacterium]